MLRAASPAAPVSPVAPVASSAKPVKKKGYCTTFNNDQAKCKEAGCIYRKDGICMLPGRGKLKEAMIQREGAAKLIQRAVRNRPNVSRRVVQSSPLLVALSPEVALSPQKCGHKQSIGWIRKKTY